MIKQRNIKPLLLKSILNLQITGHRILLSVKRNPVNQSIQNIPMDIIRDEIWQIIEPYIDENTGSPDNTEHVLQVVKEKHT